MIESKQEYEDFAHNILEATERDMFGVGDVIRLCLVALFTDGHVLLEGNPGLGKTELVKTLSRTLSLPFNRIQFTPDLMPSDITGTLMPGVNDMRKLAFRPGPIFTSLLLADEINRATPKTQSAMLEAMAERQVTVLGAEYELAQRDFKPFIQENGSTVPYPRPTGKRPRRPFVVLATQNPIDHEGTFDLPEAQSDRFMFKILMPIPDSNTLNAILEKTTTDHEKSQRNSHLTLEKYEGSVTNYQTIRKRIKSVPLGNAVHTHVHNLFLATNNRISKIETIGTNEKSELTKWIEPLNYGLGPRAATALVLGAKAWTLFFTKNSAETDGPDLACVVIPALRHRVRLKYGWQSSFAQELDSVDPDRQIDHYLYRLCVAAAPTQGAIQRGYKKLFAQALRESVEALSY